MIYDIFLDHHMKLCKMVEMYLKYDNMHTIGTINAFICINNHVNSCIKCMLSIGLIIVPPISCMLRRIVIENRGIIIIQV